MNEAEAGTVTDRESTCAVILVTGARVAARPAAVARVAGLTVLERALLVAREAGARRALIVAEAAELPTLRAAVRGPGRSLPVEYLGLDSALAAPRLADGGEVLLLRGDVVLAPQLSRRLREARGAAATVLVGQAPDDRAAAGLTLAGGRSWIGAARVPAALAGATVAGLRADPANGDAAVLGAALAAGAAIATEVPEHAWHPIRAARDLRVARAALFRSLGKPQDGWVSRHLNRPVSTIISRALVETPLTPNAISLGVFALRLAACALLAVGDRYLQPLFGFALLQLASILDGCDGEVARVKYQCSLFGARLDTALDHVSTLLLAAAVSACLVRNGGSIAYLIMAAVTIVGGAVAILAMFSYMLAIGSGSGYDVPAPTSRSSLPRPLARAFAIVGSLARIDAMYFVFLCCAVVGALELIQLLLLLGAVGLSIFYVRRRLQLGRVARRAA